MNSFEAYKICQERGHQPSDHILTSNPPQSQCKFCGTTYRYESVLIEYRIPKEDSNACD